nr:hypothetical protein [Tanacetum cinerariifolium]
MASDHVSSDPAPKCQRMALEHDSLSPGIQCQDNVPQADRTVTTSNELDFLFSLMFDELLNGSFKVNDVMRLQALVDKKRVIITEATIRDALRLNDAEGIDYLPNEEIFGAANVNVDTVLTAADESIKSSITQTNPPPPPSQDVPSTSQDAKISMDLLHNLLDTCTTLTRRVENLEQDKIAQALEITKLKQMVKKLEKRNKLKEVVVDAEIKESADVQGRQAESKAQIYQIDLEHADKVLSMQDDEVEPAEFQDVVEVVTTAKLITEVVTAASATITATETPILAVTILDAAPTLTTAPKTARRRKGVVIRDPKETATLSTIIHFEAKSKDKGKRILLEEPKPLKNQAQIEQDEAYVRKLEADLNKIINWDDVIDQVQRKEKEDNAVIMYQALKRKP